MKHIKTFEKKSLYKVGDYVVAYKDEFGVITSVNKNIKTYGEVLYYIQGEPGVYKGQPSNNNFFWARTEDIIRKMTPEEIEEFQLKQSTFLYNL